MRSPLVVPPFPALASGSQAVVKPALCLVAALALGACQRAPEPALPLGAFAPVQIDTHGATAEIRPDRPSTLEHLTEGWQVIPGTEDDPDDGHLLMAGRTSRLHFFSPDRSTVSVEAIVADPDAGAEMRRLRYCLNGEALGTLALFPGHPGFRLDFPTNVVRAGRNVLDLSIENERGGGKVEPLRVRSLRFQPLATSGEAAPPLGTRDDNDLWLPVGSVFEAALSAPPGSRLAGRLDANRFGGDEPIAVELTLADESDTRVTLLEEHLGRGASIDVDISLESWAGRTIGLRMSVAGPPTGVIRFREARLTGPAAESVRPFDLLTTPDPVTQPSGRLGRPDVVLVLLDAARADAFSAWGGPHPTPAVDRIATEGTRFERALSPSSWTGQTIPAVFTGLFPDSIGVGSWGDSLGEAMPTLAEAFAAAGYRTVLWSQHPLYRHKPALTRGFEETFIARREHRDSLPNARQLLDDERPTFAFVHFLPPHAPYDAPAPFGGRYSAGYEGDFDPSPERLNQYPSKRDPAELSAADVDYVRNLYLEKVGYADSLVGRVIETLERRDRYAGSLVGVLSDHGEGFLEHDHFLHTNQIYTELVHVPLAIKWPSTVAGFRPRVPETVTLVDLMPTLIDGVALPVGEAGFQGRSLLPSLFDGEPLDRAVYAMTSGVHRSNLPPKRQLRLELDGWSLIYDPQADRSELYRLDEDPAETTDLAAERPALALLLEQEALMQHLLNRGLVAIAAGEAETEALDPALAKELEALGYL